MLGDLLVFLRRNKKMSSLMVCREIKNIKVSEGVAEIDAEENSSLFTDKVIGEIKPFFESLGLGIKVKSFSVKDKDVSELNRLLGGHLVIN